MKWKTRVLAVACGALASALLAQESSAPQSTTSTRQVTTTTTQGVTGSVVQYTPGQSIIVRGSDGKLTTYTIGSGVQVPAEVQVGKIVTISTEPASDGSGNVVVTRVETTTVNPQGQSKTMTERTEMSSSSAPMSSPSSQSSQMTQTTTTTDVSGKVTAYQPKQSITIEQDGRAVTYMIDAESELPQDIAVGKTVTVTTRTVKGSPFVRTVTTKTVKTTTETKPQ